MSDRAESPPAGWYNDPTTANQQRWWDGAQWASATRPLTDGPPVVPPPAPAGDGRLDQTMPPPIEPLDHRPRRGNPTRMLLLVVGGFVVLLGGCVALLAGRSSDALPAENEPAVLVEEADEATEPAGSSEPTVETGADGPDTDTDTGSRQDPLPYDEAIDLTWSTVGDADGSIWTTTIGPPRDITDEVLAANEFNDPPPDGVRFVGFEAEITLVEAAVEPLAPSFNLSWEILGGSTARVYNGTTIETESFGCGVTPNDFDDFAEVFAGGTLSGTVCVPLPAEDLGHPDTRVAIRFADGDRAIFGP